MARGWLRIAVGLGPGTAALPLARPGTRLLAASGATIDRDTVTMPRAAFAVVGT